MKYRKQITRLCWLTANFLAASLSISHAAEDFTYTTNPDSTIAITSYTGAGGVVDIPATINGLPVTSIGSDAFSYCYGFTSVTMPNSITNMGSRAFYDCRYLTHLVLSSSLTTIKGSTFRYCAMTSVIIPDSVTIIEDYAFDNCSSLTNVAFGTNLMSIGYNAFSWCTHLNNIIFSESITTIGNWAFGACSSLSDVAIPDSVTSVEDYAFAHCSNITNVMLGGGITSIGSSVFYNCTKLSSLSVSDLNPLYRAADGILFNKSMDVLVQAVANITGKYTIPNGVTNIDDSAFRSCTQLEVVTIPSSVTSIGDHAFSEGLKEAYFRGSAPSIGAYAFPSQPLSSPTQVFYLPGTTNWSSTIEGCTTALWQPRLLGDTGFGTGTNLFGFNICWASGMAIVVEASIDLANSSWTPIQTNTMTDDSFYFSDPEWTNYPTRFYRVR